MDKDSTGTQQNNFHKVLQAKPQMKPKKELIEI